MTNQSNGKHIFLLEDDPDIRESICEILRWEGYLVNSAEACQDALDRLPALLPRPNLILLDLRMPGKDGYYFRAEQLKIPSIAEIPVVLLSADAHLEEKKIKLNAKDLLKKPVNIDDLIATVKRNCS